MNLKKILLLLHAVPSIMFVAGGVWVYTFVAQHKARDTAFIGSTIRAFREINDTVDAYKARAAKRQKVVVRYVATAAALKKQEDSILTAHPVAMAPADCNPWVTTLLLCRARGDSLQAAVDTLQRDKDDALRVIGMADTTLDRGTTALKMARCGFPCLHVIVGGGFDQHLRPSYGVYGGITVF